MKDPEKQSLILAHTSALLLGFIGPVIKILNAPTEAILFGRSLFEAITLLFVCIVAKRSLRFDSPRDYAALAFLGLLQAAQWYTFIFAVQLTSVAAALIATFTFPLWVALLEPLLFKERIRKSSIVTALAIVLGLYWTAPRFDWNRTTEGMAWGLLSAILIASAMLLTRKYVRKYSSLSISMYKGIIAFAAVSPVMFLDWKLEPMDWARLAFLGVFLTALPYLLITISMRSISAGRVSAIISLEPIYGTILAAVLLSEIPGPWTIAGGLLVLGAGLFQTLYNRTTPVEM